ncbi:exonuclease domain-containing protein [Microbacterium sediminis]|uniref:DNA polymerase III subunit epsilon n=1 Tax=Microbacterium sediminis TaxID=904291 RepID=A0A1B9NFX4_9MICO|nr:exonuclease domain-containing protein [Microbacterium sediminis]OCG75505.1 DNA polymerase III subunit epsilon [Microbacterium sediminis]QBR73899.1 DNA polymerase III subunit epsilon [Microbacterium sediminis]
MPLDFTAIDFETANGSAASACQVGLARVRDGRVVATAGWLIRPPAGHDVFNEWNTRIHGITAEDVRTAPGWTAQLDRLLSFVGADVLVAHNASFDTRVLRAACEATGDELGAVDYLCSLQLARRVYDLPSYKLPAAAAAAGHAAFAHHDAAADALACAQIVIDAGRRTGAADVAALAAAVGVRLARTEPVAARAIAA